MAFLKGRLLFGGRRFGFLGRSAWIDQHSFFNASQPRGASTCSSPRRAAIQHATFGPLHWPPSSGGVRKRSRKASRSSSDKSGRAPRLPRRRSPAPRRHGAHSAPPACSAAPASSRGTCAMRSANGCASALRNASAGARRCLSGQTRGRTPIAFLHPFCSQAKSWMRRNRDLQAVSPCRLPLITDVLYCFQRQRTDEHDPILGSRARVADARTSPLVAPKALRRQLNSSGIKV